VLPDVIFPPLKRIKISGGGAMGVAIDGSDKCWPGDSTLPVLPAFSPFQSQPRQYIEVFNRGAEPFPYRVEPSVRWMRVDPAAGSVKKEVRCLVGVDWTRAPKGVTKVPITVTGPGGAVVGVQAIVENPDVTPAVLSGFIEANGCVSFEADHYARQIGAGPISWKRIPDIGRTGSGMTPMPVTAPRQTPGGAGLRLEYDVHLFSAGQVRVWAYLSPRNDVRNAGGLRYAVSIDDAKPQIVNITTALGGIPMNRSWERNTSNNVNLTSSVHSVSAPGKHVVKFWMVDPTVIVQKLVLDMGGVRESYFGPPESFRAAGRPAK
jgi:hypothetical protein